MNVVPWTHFGFWDIIFWVKLQKETDLWLLLFSNSHEEQDSCFSQQTTFWRFLSRKLWTSDWIFVRCACVRGGWSLDSGVFLNHFLPILFFETGSLCLTKLAKFAGWKTPRDLHLSVSLVLEYRIGLPCWLSLWMLGIWAWVLMLKLSTQTDPSP